jgi:hypothetical protein
MGGVARLRSSLSLSLSSPANVIINLGFELYSSLANVMWDEYRSAASENIDTVVVGSSTGQRSFDPAVLDATLGATTFNMAHARAGVG